MIRIGNRDFFPEKHTYIMGILNVTPDSFSDGSHFKELDAALRHVEEMVREGADIIDIGGESTRPGADPVDAEEEISRVLPVIEAVTERFDIPLSLDTYKASTARMGAEAGVHMINDIWGLKGDRDMAAVVGASGLPVCISHNRNDTDYSDFVTDVISDLKESIDIASRNGITPDRIILDPGVGFAKTLEQNLEIIAGLRRISDIGYPVLLGVSRKSVIGRTLGLDVKDRLEGSLAAAAWGVMHGAGFLRVHDVQAHVRLVRMLEAIGAYACPESRGETGALADGKPYAHTAYLSFGSNMGDRQGYIDKALKLLEEDPQIGIVKVSSVIETAPYGGVEQDPFLNGAVMIRTAYAPEALLDRINEIELLCDRVRRIRWGPRTLDLDILLYDDEIIDTRRLTVPHTDMANRDFVLDPLCEIAPDVIHPVLGVSVKEMRDNLKHRS